MFRLRHILLLVSAGLLVVCATAIAFAKQNTLAIFNLRPTNIEAMGYNGDILYALISSLEGEKSIEVMPRREMEEILFHAGIVQGDNPELVSQAGKVLGIKYILFGQVTKKGEKIQAFLNLMDIDASRIVRSWSPTYIGRDEILREIPQVILELSDTIHKQDRTVRTGDTEPGRSTMSIENLQARSEGNAVLLKWKTPSTQKASGFNLYRAQMAEGPFQNIGKTDQNTFRDTTVEKGRSYYYRVGILDPAGKETKSDQTTRIQSVGEKVPYPPLILGVTGHVRRALIKFVPSLLNDQEKFKIEKYKVYRRKDSPDGWEVIAEIDAAVTSQSELAFYSEDTGGLQDGQKYSYAVSSVDRQKRESPMSDPISAKTIQRPALIVDKQNLLRKVILAWDPISNSQGYNLYRKSGGDNWERVGNISDAAVFRFEDKEELEDGRRYEYHLTAYDKKGETGPSNTVTASTKQRPSPPQDLLVQSGLVKSVRLSWTPINDPDVGGYIIHRGSSRDSLKELTKIKGHQTDTFLDKGSTFDSLEDGREYYYAIAGYNLFGAEGQQTRPAVAKTKPRPGSVRGLMVNASGQQIEIKWQPNLEPDINVYILSRDRNIGFWSTLAELDAGKTAYVDVDLKPETSYRYRIVVVDKDGLKSDPVESRAILSPIIKPKK